MERKIICLTGPMAAGKNAVSSVLETLGFACVDADKLSHVAVEVSKKEILAAFSKKAEALNIRLLNDDGTLNRRNLGAVVFSDPEFLATHESIVYPVVKKLAFDFIDRHKDQNVVLNATVLYKIPELLDLCSMILYVDAPKIKRFFRVCKRDGMKARLILDRFRAQKNLFDKYRSSGKKILFINNTGNFEGLSKNVISAVAEILS